MSQKTKLTMTLAPVPVTDIALNHTAEDLNVGDELSLAATVTPSNATDPSVYWASSDTAVATVDSSTPFA